ncbi:MAG: ArnT family glycosyltransferase [Thermogutta sp.]
MPAEKVKGRFRAGSSQPFWELMLTFAVAIFWTGVTALSIAPEMGGPGVTCDELYHVLYGKRLVASVLTHGLGFFRPLCITETFGWHKDGPPVHPPLGNWVLGWANWLFDPKPLDLEPIAVTPARLGTAVCFGLLSFILGLFCTRRYGLLSGISAAFSLMCMPRLFGHAHLAALDLITALMCTASIVSVIWADNRERWYGFLLAGIVWGMALLTRFHGLLCLPPICGYMVYRWRRRALLPLALWFAAGMITFFIGWPWLWLDPLGHLRQYLSSSTQRIHIHTFYMGRIWNDTAVPWHYPWIMFLVTLPVGIIVLGTLGIISLRPERRSASKCGNQPSERELAAGWLVLGTICFFLLVFSVPGVPVYDGVRLFLPVYPLWAILVGRGVSVFWQFLDRIMPRRHVLHVCTLSLFLALQGIGTLWFRPVWLSYYNCLVSGLWGAEKLGFEINYWGDALTEKLICRAAEQISPEERLTFAPSLAPYQAAGILAGSACLIERGIPLAPWSPGLEMQSRDGPKVQSSKGQWILLYRRRADISENLHALTLQQPVAEVSRQGVWLARLVRINGPLSPQLTLASTDARP